MFNPQQQLPLALGLKDSAVFANFVAAENAEAVAYLQGLVDTDSTPPVYLWGENASGKSHLLQALCHAAGERSEAAVYLPMQEVISYPYESLQGLENMRLVCIDDIDAIAGHVNWEAAVLRLFERAHSNRCLLVLTATALVNDIGLRLPQLASRLAWGLVYHLKPLTQDNDALEQALLIRAERRGIQLADAATRYLLRHYGQNAEILFSSLDRLDQASLIAKRRLTVPFIRSILGS